ncbi:MAG TPA: heme-binding protein [Acidothermaceae bacterium]|jgi:uncharacterized protein GlcG (DUF336 family)
MPTQTWALTESDVSGLLRSVTDSAREQGIAVTVAVVETGGNIIGLARMDGARLPSTHVAPMKAWTAAMFQRPSSAYQESTSPGGGAFGLWNAFPGRLVPLGGGIPLFVGDTCVGAVGVSGGTSDQDEQLAVAAATLLHDAGA